ncbi:hypothetical protein F5877DRAFT_68693 [Lentinula edodes]|nr:hypothetical protein F5877DRAFT_68693 [Lentinula edodes]
MPLHAYHHDNKSGDPGHPHHSSHSVPIDYLGSLGIQITSLEGPNFEDNARKMAKEQGYPLTDKSTFMWDLHEPLSSSPFAEKRKDSALDPSLDPSLSRFMEAISSEIAEKSEEAPPQVEKEIDEEQAKNAEKKKSESGRKRMPWRPTTRLLDPDHASKKAFSPSKKIIQTSSSLSSVVLDASGLALGALATAAQYAPTPYLGTLASISLSIVNAIQGAKDNKDSLKQLASTITKNSVSDAESKLFSSDPMLNQQVEDLLSTLREIEDIVQRQVSRTLIRRVISSRSDSNIIQDYKDHLNQALESFTLQSNIVLRETLLRVQSKQEELVLYSTSFVARPPANIWWKVAFTGKLQVKEDQPNGTRSKSRMLFLLGFLRRNQSCLRPFKRSFGFFVFSASFLNTDFTTPNSTIQPFYIDINAQ